MKNMSNTPNNPAVKILWQKPYDKYNLSVKMEVEIKLEKLPPEIILKVASSFKYDQLDDIIASSKYLHNVFTNSEYANNFWKDMMIKRYGPTIFDRLGIQKSNEWFEIYNRFKDSSAKDIILYMDSENMYDLTTYFGKIYKRIEISDTSTYLLDFDGSLYIIPGGYHYLVSKNKYFDITEIPTDKIPNSILSFHNMKHPDNETRIDAIKLTHIDPDDKIIDIHRTEWYSNAGRENTLQSIYAKTKNNNVLVLSPFAASLLRQSSIVGDKINIIESQGSLVYFGFKDGIEKIKILVNPYTRELNIIFIAKTITDSTTYAIYSASNGELIKVCDLPKNFKVRYFDFVDGVVNMFYIFDTLYILTKTGIIPHKIGYQIRYANVTGGIINLLNNDDEHISYQYNPLSPEKFEPTGKKDNYAITDDIWKYHDFLIKNGTIVRIKNYRGGILQNLNIRNVINVETNTFHPQSDFFNTLIFRRE